MKKLVSLIAVLFIFSSCQDEVKFNEIYEDTREIEQMLVSFINTIKNTQ